MLLQTNSYIVPKDKRAEHARLLRRFRASLAKLGCDSFEVYEQVGSNWTTGEPTGRYVQIMRFRDRRHQLSVQAAERSDPVAQAIIAEFCQLINFPYQQQQGLFAVGFYNSVLPVAPARPQAGDAGDAGAGVAAGASGQDFEHGEAPAEADLATGAGEAVDESAYEEVPAEEGEPEDVPDVADEPAADVAEDAGAEVRPDEAGAAPADDEQIGALLDPHIESPRDVGETQSPSDESADGLDVIDLDSLDLPDGSASESGRASNHVAR